MRKHAKEIVNIACWVAYGVMAYILEMAALGLAKWYFADKYIAPSLWDKSIVALIVAVIVAPKVFQSARAIMKGGA